MGLRASSVAALAAVAAFWMLSGTQHERPLLGGAAQEHLRAVEVDAARHPDDPRAILALAEAYLDAQQPGLAVSLVEGASPASRADVHVRHAYARALVDQGRNDLALAVEEGVVASCRPLADSSAAPGGCGPVLLALALRRTAILSELIALGVEDSGRSPEESLVAYRNATREARVMLQ